MRVYIAQNVSHEYEYDSAWAIDGDPEDPAHQAVGSTRELDSGTGRGEENPTHVANCCLDFVGAVTEVGH